MRNCADSKCGLSIDDQDLNFLDTQPNLVYMDKVYSYKKGRSCPIILHLDTGDEDFGDFVIEITTFSGSNSRNDCCDCNCDCGCGCGCTDTCEMLNLDQIPKFTVEESYAEVSYFNTNPPGNVEPMIASFDGVPACDITYLNGRYSINTADLDSQVQLNRCAVQGLPTKTFFLLRNAGPWMMRATYYLEGTVTGNGKICCFKAKIFNAKNGPNTLLPLTAFSDFAIEDLALPCTTDGIAPDVLFQFRADINMINPRLTIDRCSGEVILRSDLAVIPTIQVEVTRKSLFKVDAREAILPCDGVREDEDIIYCNNNRHCHNDREECGCNNNNNYHAHQVIGANCCRW